MADDDGQGSLPEKTKNKTENMEEEEEEEDFFEVEQIIGKCKIKGVVTYKVRWKSYGAEEDTWEPIDNLDSCQELIEEFNKKRDESLKQKAEERKQRQAIMEGRMSSPESSDEGDGTLYPPNFKNSFWKDLEAGRIDVFDSNMYSKVKERTVKLQSLREYQEQELESDRRSSDEVKKLTKPSTLPSRRCRNDSDRRSSDEVKESRKPSLLPVRRCRMSDRRSYDEVKEPTKPPTLTAQRCRMESDRRSSDEVKEPTKPPTLTAQRCSNEPDRCDEVKNQTKPPTLTAQRCSNEPDRCDEVKNQTKPPTLALQRCSNDSDRISSDEMKTPSSPPTLPPQRCRNESERKSSDKVKEPSLNSQRCSIDSGEDIKEPTKPSTQPSQRCKIESNIIDEVKKTKVQKTSDCTPKIITKLSTQPSQRCNSTPVTPSCSKKSRLSKSKRKKTETETKFSIQTDSSDSDTDCERLHVFVDNRTNKLPSSEIVKDAGQRKGIKLIMKLPKPPGDKDGIAIVTTKHVESSDLYRPGSPRKRSRLNKPNKHKHTDHKHSEHKHTEPKHSEHKNTEPNHSEPKHTEHKHTEPKHTEPKHTELKHIEHKPTVEVKSSGLDYSDIDLKDQKSELSTDILNKNGSNNLKHRKRKISECTESGLSVAMDSFKSNIKMEDSAVISHNSNIVFEKQQCVVKDRMAGEPEFDPDIDIKTEDFEVHKGNCSFTLKVPEGNCSLTLNAQTPVTPQVDTLQCRETQVNYGGYDNWNVPINSNVYIQSSDTQNHPGLSAIKTEHLFDLSQSFRSHDVLHHNHTTISQNCASTPTFSHNMPQDSHVNSGSFIPSFNTNTIHTSSYYDFSQTVLDYNNSNGVCANRRDSETVDSGIASPASEKSLGLLSCSDSMNPLEDVLSESILPFNPDSEKIEEKEPDHDFEIDLDEIDWDLFDREVKLEPITISDGEFVKAVMTGNYELVKRAFMGNGKYNLEHIDQSGQTLLMHAVQHRCDDIADLLIEHGASINSQMTNGFTPLMIACQFAELCTVNLLIELGAKVNIQAYNGESALMVAVRRGHKHMTWLLLECGANFSFKSHAGYTALSYARAFNHIDTESVIRTHVDRVMSEFHRQVSVTLKNLANIREMVFPPQVFNISEEELFHVNFNYTSKLPPIHGLGYILFLGHAVFTSEEVKCRFSGPCAVKAACLNGVTLSPLTQEGNFVLAFNPVIPGNNQLTINTVKEMDMKGKLIVCAYKAQLV